MSRPPLQRQTVLLPCPVHGHPETALTGAGLFYLNLFFALFPYSVYVGIKRGKEIEQQPIVNLEILRLVCQELGLEFRRAWQWVETIYEVWDE